MKLHHFATRSLSLGLCGLIAALIAAPSLAVATEDQEMVRVFMNQARILKLDRPVAKVIIGNSGVADATVADAQTIVLTGHAYGTTNLVLLDEQGNAIVDKRILVSIDEGNTVRVFKQTSRTVYSCTPNCEEHADITSSDSSSSSTTSTGE